MTDSGDGPSSTRRSRSAPAHSRAGSGGAALWLGWVLFIGILLCVAGLINVLQGLVALFDDDFYLSSSDFVVDSYTVWGWALLILGAALVAAGGGVMLGYEWARVTGVVAASINALVNFGFMTAYPAWSILVVSFDVLAIYALVVHGGAAKALRITRG